MNQLTQKQVLLRILSSMPRPWRSGPYRECQWLVEEPGTDHSLGTIFLFRGVGVFNALLPNNWLSRFEENEALGHCCVQKCLYYICLRNKPTRGTPQVRRFETGGAGVMGAASQDFQLRRQTNRLVWAKVWELPGTEAEHGPQHGRLFQNDYPVQSFVEFRNSVDDDVV